MTENDNCDFACMWCSYAWFKNIAERRYCYVCLLVSNFKSFLTNSNSCLVYAMEPELVQLLQPECTLLVKSVTVSESCHLQTLDYFLQYHIIGLQILVLVL